MSKATSDIADLKVQLGECQQTTEAQRQQIEALTKELEEQQCKIADYQDLINRLDEYKDKTREQNRIIRRERNRYKRASEELHQKNEENERKNRELTEIMHLVDKQKNKLRDQKRELMRQKRELDRSNKLLAKMNQELSEKNRELTRMSDELYRMAHTDALTDLYNRRTFIDQLELEFQKALRYNRTICCVIFDIDNFKKVNDTYGHLQGDEVLRQLARISKDVSRNCDIVARYGGEEFVLLLPETDSRGGAILAERLRRAVEKFRFPYLDNPSEGINITISLGVADSQEKGIGHHEKLLNCADSALYFCKNHGKNQIKIYSFEEVEAQQSEVIPFPEHQDKN